MENDNQKKKAKTIEEKLEAAKQKLQQLKAQKQRQEARQRAKSAKEERAKDTRKKILVGALVLTREAHGATSHPSSQVLALQLTRDDDRALFDLPPVAITPPPTPSK